MKRLIILVLVLFQLFGAVVAEGETAVDFPSGQYFAHQGDTLLFYGESRVATVEGIFEIRLEGLEAFQVGVYQVQQKDRTLDGDEHQISNIDGVYTSDPVGKNSFARFIFKITIENADPKKYQLKITIIEQSTKIEKSYSFSLFVIPSSEGTKQLIQNTFKEEFAKHPEELFIFPDVPVWVKVTSPPIKESGTFHIRIDTAPGMFQYDVYEAGNGGTVLTEENGEYTSGKVNKGETREFYVKMTCIREKKTKKAEEVVLEIAEISICISEKNCETNKTEYTYRACILPDSSRRSFLPALALLLIIPLAALVLYQHRTISKLKKENARLGKMIGADRDVLKDIMMRL